MAGVPQLEPVDLSSPPVEGTVTWAAQNGSRLDSLYALRNVITRHLDSERTLARDLAALSRQYLQVSKEIEELEAIGKQYDEVEEGVSDEQDAPFRPEAI